MNCEPITVILIVKQLGTYPFCRMNCYSQSLYDLCNQALTRPGKYYYKSVVMLKGEIE